MFCYVYIYVHMYFTYFLRSQFSIVFFALWLRINHMMSLQISAFILELGKATKKILTFWMLKLTGINHISTV